MGGQSISFTPPIDEWLKLQVKSQEFTSKSDVVNDLIRKIREIEYIRNRLIKAEKNGFTTATPEENLQEAKGLVRDNGAL